MISDISKAMDQVDWRPIEHIKVVGEDVYATHQGFIHVAGESLGVFKMSNGDRVFNAEDVARFIGVPLGELNTTEVDDER